MKLLLTGDSIVARKEGLKEPRLNATLKSYTRILNLITRQFLGLIPEHFMLC